MPDIIREFSISLEQVRDYEFLVKFDDLAETLLMDAPPGVGRNAGPCPTQMLAAAVGNCLTMTLVLFARKAGLQPTHVRAAVKARLVRGENGLPRMGAIDVALEPGFHEADQARCGGLPESLRELLRGNRERAGGDRRASGGQPARVGRQLEHPL